MKKNKVFLTTIFLLSTSFVMVSCGEDSVNDTKTTYRVNFENTNLEEVTINEGDKLNEVEASNKDGYRFVGWYLDSGFNNEVNFPLTITSNSCNACSNVFSFSIIIPPFLLFILLNRDKMSHFHFNW